MDEMLETLCFPAERRQFFLLGLKFGLEFADFVCTVKEETPFCNVFVVQ